MILVFLVSGLGFAACSTDKKERAEQPAEQLSSSNQSAEGQTAEAERQPVAGHTQAHKVSRAERRRRVLESMTPEEQAQYCPGANNQKQ